MKVGGNTKNDALVMTAIDAVEERLILGGIPWDVEHHHSLAGDQVHAVGGIWFTTREAIGGIYITVTGQVRNDQGRVGLRNDIGGEYYHQQEIFHDSNVLIWGAYCFFIPLK